MAKHRVPRTRNHGTWTEAQFFSRLRSSLRKMSMYWKPAHAALNAVKRPAPPGVRHKHEYQCAVCHGWFKRSDVQVDHIIPCGSLKSFEDLPGFAERLFCEDPAGYQAACKSCHQSKTNEDRQR